MTCSPSFGSLIYISTPSSSSPKLKCGLPQNTQPLGIGITPQLADAICNVMHDNPFAGFAFVGDAR